MEKSGEKSPIDEITLYTHLQNASRRKLQKQSQIENILPPEDTDFSYYFETILPATPPKPESDKRGDMRNHYVNLCYHARGLPEVVALHVLLISYLRRQTPYQAHAWSLFERLWQDHGEALLELIPNRDLVSAFRTFCDHSTDPQRRIFAKLCFTYSHLIKLYESERFYDQLPFDDMQFNLPQPCPAIGIDKLWGVRLGGDNSFEILNVELAEEIFTDEILGPMLIKFMWHIYSGESIFSRFDRKRVEQGFDIDNIRQWSFGFNPFQALDEDSTEA